MQHQGEQPDEQGGGDQVEQELVRGMQRVRLTHQPTSAATNTPDPDDNKTVKEYSTTTCEKPEQREGTTRAITCSEGQRSTRPRSRSRSSRRDKKTKKVINSTNSNTEPKDWKNATYKDYETGKVWHRDWRDVQYRYHRHNYTTSPQYYYGEWGDWHQEVQDGEPEYNNNYMQADHAHHPTE